MKRSLAGALVIGAIAVAAAGAEPDAVTIAAAPGVVRWPDGTFLAGRVSNGRAGELVNLQAKECPARSFNTAASIRTTAGGAWAAGMGVETKTVLRARWRSARSREVVVLVRPHLVLGQISNRVFRANLTLGRFANGKRLALQTFGSGGWTTVKTFVFRSPSTGWPQMTFPVTVPKGTTLRLTLSRAQARPCYLAGYSNLLRT